MAGWNILAAAVMAASAFVYGTQKKKGDRKILVWKAFATFMGVLVSAAGAAAFQDGWRWLLTAGLTLCMAADVLLEVKLPAGACCFGLAHLCFLAVTWMLGGWNRTAMILSLVFYVVFACSYARHLPQLGKLKIPALVYPALLCLMAGTALAAVWSAEGKAPAALGAGAFLFLASDYLLVGRTMGKTGKKRDAAILVLYYSAVWLMALQ